MTWKWNWAGTFVLSFTLLAVQCGCSANVANLTDNDIDRIGALSDIAKSWGPEGSLRIRAGRPFLAGLFEGVLVIPGVEIDMDASADPARAPANETPESIPTEPETDVSLVPLDPDTEYTVTVKRGGVEKQLTFLGETLVIGD